MIRTALVLWLLSATWTAALELFLPLGAAAPYRVGLLADPPGISISVPDDVSIEPGDMPPEVAGAALQAGAETGWVSLVLDLDRPYALDTVVLERTPVIGLRLVLAPLGRRPEQRSESALPGAPQNNIEDAEPVIIVLDPGHGGADPGATRDGWREADLMLDFANRLKAVLEDDGHAEVLLTRQTDTYLGLSERVNFARDAGAAALISLHADALAEGRASGAVIYTLAESSVEAVDRELVTQHNRADVIAGLDLTDTDDILASVLIEMARRTTGPASEALAGKLHDALALSEIDLQSTPRRGAAFRVLKSVDVPAVLVELGFMSDAGDLENLTDPDWQAAAADALAEGIRAWIATEAFRSDR